MREVLLEVGVLGLRMKGLFCWTVEETAAPSLAWLVLADKF